MKDGVLFLQERGGEERGARLEMYCRKKRKGLCWPKGKVSREEEEEEEMDDKQ